MKLRELDINFKEFRKTIDDKVKKITGNVDEYIINHDTIIRKYNK